MGSSIPQVEDINNDGNLDIINSSYYCDIYYYEGNGTDSFPEYKYFKLEDGRDLNFREEDWQSQINGKRVYGAVEVYDWNEDGLIDILFTSGHIPLQWYENVGTKEEPLFKAGEKILLNGSDILYERPSIEVYDINMDGKKDLVIGTQKRGCYLPNSGTNSSPKFEEEHEFYYGDSIKIEMNGMDANPIHGEIQVHVTDWNSDGYPDLLVGENCGWTIDPPFEMLYLFMGIPDEDALVSENVLPNGNTLNFMYNNALKALCFKSNGSAKIKFEIFTLSGRQIENKTVQSGQIVSLESCHNGIYVVRYTLDDMHIGSEMIVIQ